MTEVTKLNVLDNFIAAIAAHNQSRINGPNKWMKGYDWCNDGCGSRTLVGEPCNRLLSFSNG